MNVAFREQVTFIRKFIRIQALYNTNPEEVNLSETGVKSEEVLNGASIRKKTFYPSGEYNTGKIRKDR
ncbi:MAG: hypothetical protein HC906_12320 [Bacteroidales bacterium]|nr:hypothetical protein [Bacteroidales bacterium]